MAEVVRELVAQLTFEVDASGVNEFEEGVEGAGEAAEETGVKTIALGNIVANAAKRFTDFAINAAKQTVAALHDIVLGSAEAADEIAKMSKQLGVDAEQLQRLRGAADLSGASIEDMNRGIRALTVGLSDAKTKGTGPVVEGLETLGLSVGDLEALLAEGDVEGAMGLISDAFNETGDSAEKNAALMKLFGARAGAQLRPLLEAGSDGILEMGDAIQATGEVIDNETLPTFEKMQDDLRLIEGTSKGLKNQISAALAPVISDIATKFNEWVAENQEFINQDLPELLGQIADVLSLVLPWVIDTIQEFQNFTREIGHMDDRLTQDFGPTWTKTKDLLWKVLDPLSAILDFVNAVIDRMDAFIGRFQKVTDLAVEAGALTREGKPTDVRGGVGFGESAEDRESRLRNTEEDRQRIEEAERQEEADRERRSVEEAQAAQGFVRDVLRERNAEGRKLNRYDINAMVDAGASEAAIENAVRVNEEALARKKAGKGGGGKGRGKGGGKSKSEPTIGDLIEGASPSSRGSSIEGGGQGPGLGGTFNTINATYSPSTRIELNIPPEALEGFAPETQGRVIATEIERVLEERDTRVFENFAQVVRE